MAATSEQMVMPTGQHSITSASSHETPLGSTTAATKALTHNKTHSLSGTSIRSSKSEHRPSFSITLPPSCSRSSHLTSHSLVFNTLAGPDDDNDSTAGFEEALALQQEGNGASDNSGSQYHARLQTLDPPVRRRSVQFIPGMCIVTISLTSLPLFDLEHGMGERLVHHAPHLFVPSLTYRHPPLWALHCIEKHSSKIHSPSSSFYCSPLLSSSSPSPPPFYLSHLASHFPHPPSLPMRNRRG
ncbi:MAG: hypothetical protein J3R72DRAFT_431986 [Linnemannia gamsii]|nr:MAG: hypothetical protein J3R72DRAFT_431986 [Linnemannia gamsii]